MTQDSRQSRNAVSGTSLSGIPLKTSPYIPEDKVVMIAGEAWFHSRLSARGRMRRKHGRPSNAPRRLKVRHVRYQPALDRLLEAVR